MKRIKLLYLVALGTTLFVTACKKDDDEPAAPAVVGNWEFDRLQRVDVPASHNYLNGTGIDTYFNIGSKSEFDIKSDKTFIENYYIFGNIQDFDGTWEFNNNALTLDYTNTQIQNETFTYDPTRERLLGEKFAISDTIPNQTTQQPEVVRYNLQYVYRKK